MGEETPTWQATATCLNRGLAMSSRSIPLMGRPLERSASSFGIFDPRFASAFIEYS